MKKLLALLLVLTMVLSMAACGGNKESTATTGAAATTGETTGETVEELTGEAGRYTYNSATGSFPNLWNPHTYETETASSMVLDYIWDGFYAFDYNEDETGFQMVPSMITDEHPVDITADYVGQYGIEEGDTAQVYLMHLRDDLRWETGEQITANDYVESAKRLLDPVAKNYRADSLYTGDVVIYNAEAYMKAGQVVKQDNGSTGAYAIADLVKGEDGTYTTPDGGAVYIAVSYPITQTGGDSLAAYVEAYGDQYFVLDTWEELAALANEDGLAPLTDESLALLTPVTTGNPAWNETEADLPNYLVYEQSFPEMDFSEVGIFALSDTELVYVLDSPMEGFYLKYGLPSSYLVHIPTYDACTKVSDGVYTNSYGTTAETTVSYGPYKMVEFQADKVIRYERNEYYFDLTEDTYQTTDIEIQYVSEAATRLQMLISGKLDGYGLQSDDFATYSLSDNCYYSKGASTYGMVFNPDMDALTTTQQAAGANINKTILTLTSFRQAMAYGINRAEFILATSPAGAPAFGLFSDLHTVDPDTGVGYRTTDIAKQVLADFWGVADEIGEGKLYETIDEAIDSLTGYNPDLAKVKFNEAYDEAIAQGLMDEDDVVELVIGLPSTSPVYTNGYEFIVNCYTELVKGTKMEGKLTFKSDDTIADNFATCLQDNQVDMLFYVGWSGMELNPYGLMQAYVEPAYQYDSHYDYKNIDLTINLDGVDYTTDMYSWYEIMQGLTRTITAADGTTKEYSCGSADGEKENRLQILGSLEGAVLMNYNFIPLSGNATAQLKGMQIQYHTEEYIWGMGFGGIKYYTYNYDDAQWADYVNSQGGKLDYT